MSDVVLLRTYLSYFNKKYLNNLCDSYIDIYLQPCYHEYGSAKGCRCKSDNHCS